MNFYGIMLVWVGGCWGRMLESMYRSFMIFTLKILNSKKLFTEPCKQSGISIGGLFCRKKYAVLECGTKMILILMKLDFGRSLGFVNFANLKNDSCCPHISSPPQLNLKAP